MNIPKYQEQYEIMHRRGKVYHGACLKDHAKEIGNLIKDTDSKSLLDYGSGKGTQYFKYRIHKEHFYDIMPTLYDIGIQQFSDLPNGKFDGVFSTDVMEHIPEEELDDVFSYIYKTATKFVYLAICTIPAPDLLPNGEQAHVTLKPIEWWVEKINKYANVYTVIHCYGLETQIETIGEK